jgi:serine kinase of HPr protein (carbohydrate metabolism regulator)
MAATHPSETLHAGCVAIDGRALLLLGPSGAGKSDLALRLIDRGAMLVSDDYTLIRHSDGALIASAPPTIAGNIEVRGIGIIARPHLAQAPVALALDLAQPPERFPMERLTLTIAGVEVPLMRLSPFEASAPLKAEMMLARLATGHG